MRPTSRLLIAVTAAFLGAPAVVASQPLSEIGDIVRIAPASFEQLRFMRPRPTEVAPVGDMEGVVGLQLEEQRAVASPVAGRIARVLVRNGQSVARGQPVIEVESDEMAALAETWRQALAARERAERSLAALRREQPGPDPSAGPLAQKRVDEERAEIAVADAERALGTVRSRIRLIVRRAHIDIDKLDGEWSPSRTLTLCAPVDGSVSGLHASAGQAVAPLSLEPLAIVVPEPARVLVIDAPPLAAAYLRRGSPVQISVGADAVSSVVESISPIVDAETQRMAVHVKLPMELRTADLGTRVRVSLPQSPPRVRATLVPDRAIIRRGARAAAWVVVAPSFLELREVSIGASADGWTLVFDGLSVTDMVALAPKP